MPRTTDPSRIFQDPRLADRRGDPAGPLALAFLLVLLVGFGAAGAVLLSLPAVVVDPSPRPSPSPTAARSPARTPAPAAGPAGSPRPGAAATPAARATPGPTARATRGPGRTPSASRVPRRTQAPAAVTVEMRQAAPIVLDGRTLGTVTARTFQRRALPDRSPEPGTRVMVLDVEYVASGRLPYGAGDWVAIDMDGERYPSLGAPAPDPALGSGRLAAGESVSGNVAFALPDGVTVRALVLTDGEGRDVVVVDRRPGT